VTVLNRGPVPERPTPFPANSLAHGDACELLDAAALSVIPGIDVHDSGFANWECAWESTAADAVVDVSFSQDDDLTDDGRPMLLGGRQSYVTPKEYHDHNCVVRVRHRGYTDTAGEPTVELVVVAVDGPQPVDEVCHTAKTLATAVAEKLPEP
jgi:eukaryotic-like serine/threonine-protein kinase